MTDQTNQTENQTENKELTPEQKAAQLSMLKKRADLIGVTYSNNIGIDALRAKIAAKVSEEQAANIQESNQALDSTPDHTSALAADKEELTPNQKIYREQMALVRCRITNLDPKKRDLPGEIFCVANRVLGTVRKFIPYGELTEDGFHLPRVLFNELDSRKFNHTTSRKDKKTGQTIVETKWVKEFSLDVLPPLTQEELNRLATAQIAAGTAAPLGELS